MTSVDTETGTVRLLIIGPPGAGKGTQAVKLAEIYGIPAISTGDIFRANIKGGTELGKKVQAIVESGAYVPDALTNDLVRDRLLQPDAASGFLLDGYPRTTEQVAELDRLLVAGEAGLTAVIQLVANVDEVVERLRKRALIEGRADDTEDVLRHRQEVYSEQTAPLIEHYADRGLVVVVDALGDVDEVTERIVTALSSR